MWTIIIFLIFSILVLFNLVRVMIYGKGVFKPDFRKADEKLSTLTGFGSKWNTTFGKSVYYILLIATALFCIY